MTYRNSEWYNDPTAGIAMGRVMRDSKRKKKGSRRQSYFKTRPMVYVVSPYAGDIEFNTNEAIRYCRFVADMKFVPVASHLIYPRILNDSNAEEREMGLMFGLSLMAHCSEVWVFGTKLTDGMRLEVSEALRLNIPTKYIKAV